MKRQQATEDAIAMGLRAVATGAPVQGYLPPGPIFGLPVTEPLETEGSDVEGDRHSTVDKHSNSDNGAESDSSGKTIEYSVDDAVLAWSMWVFLSLFI